MDGSKVINGTWGEVWIDGVKVSEAIGLKAKGDPKYDPIPVLGQLNPSHKLVGTENTGSIEMHKVNSRMAILIADYIAKGKTPKFTIVSKLKDPDSAGAERVVLYGVVFTSLTLIDWTAAQNGKITETFLYERSEFLDKIPV